MKSRTRLMTLGATMLLTVAGVGLVVSRSHAADHLDPPARTNPDVAGATVDRAADIADLFVWHRGTGANRSLVTILTFAGPNAVSPTQAIPCDRDVIYNINIDNSGDAVPELVVSARFGKDSVGNCYVRFTGVPGSTLPVDGRVEHAFSSGGVSLYAGLRDDAFFFDLQGFKETLMVAGTATPPMGIRMTSDRDFFAHSNTPAIAVEMPLASALGTGTQLKVWASTARITTP